MPFPYKLANTTVAPNKIYPQLTGHKFLVIGHAGHGKDTVGDMLENVYGMTSMSSSLFACENVILPAMAEVNAQFAEDGLPLKYPDYISVEECYNDRGNHREFWYNAIANYNAKEHDRLAVDLLEQYDVHLGMRSPKEYGACYAANLFDMVIWVDAQARLPKEELSSMKLSYDPRNMKFVNNNFSVQRAAAYLDSIMEVYLNKLSTTDLGASR